MESSNAELLNRIALLEKRVGGLLQMLGELAEEVQALTSTMELFQRSYSFWDGKP